MLGTIRLISLSMLLFLMSFCRQNEKKQVIDEPAKAEEAAKEESKAPFSEGKEMSVLKSKKLNEVSGLSASVVNPGMLWTLNDSNNPAEVYLIDMETNIKQTYVLKGISNRDWEEIAVGPGPEQGANYVYVGDIGDNMAAHEFKYIYRFKEPAYKDGSSKKIDITEFDTITFSLSDERRDTEAFFIDPGTLDIYVISKWKSHVDLYQLKNSESTKGTKIAQHVGTLPLSTVVAADMTSDGKELLIKTYKSVFYWNRPADMSVLNMLKKPATVLPYKQEPQGEAIAWATGGDGYYTLSEQKKNEQVHLLFYARN